MFLRLNYTFCTKEKDSHKDCLPQDTVYSMHYDFLYQHISVGVENAIHQQDLAARLNTTPAAAKNIVRQARQQRRIFAHTQDGTPVNQTHHPYCVWEYALLLYQYFIYLSIYVKKLCIDSDYTP